MEKPKSRKSTLTFPPIPLVNPRCYLPQKDPDLPGRQYALSKEQTTYIFQGTTSVGGYHGQGFVGMPGHFAKIPPTFDIPRLPEETNKHVWDFVYRAAVAEINKLITQQFSKPVFDSLEDYAKAVGFLKPPPITTHSKKIEEFLNDVEFGRQKLQGASPEMLTKITKEKWDSYYSKKFPVHLPEVKAEIEKIIKQSIDEALKEGVLFISDYSLLDKPEFKLYAWNFNRYTAAPLALFWNDAKGSQNLLPVCIQLFPEYDPETNPILFPDDSLDWLLAKIWVNSVDGGYMEFVFHLFECHLITEAILVATDRCLGERHPIKQLLKPHFLYTLKINDMAREDLMALSGPINQTIGGGTVGGLNLIHEYFSTWTWQEHTFKASLRNRGFSDDPKVSDGVHGYWWRDDGLKVWNIINTFVSSVIKTFYSGQEDIDKDFELVTWLQEIASPTAGNVPGLTKTPLKFQGVDELIEVVTDIIWNSTAKHSVGNAAQFDMYGFIPNVAGALYIPPVIKKGTTDMKTIMSALPPRDPTLDQIAIVYILSQIHADLPMLGQTPYTFLEKDCKDAIELFKKQLSDLSQEITDRNKAISDPLYQYDYLNPINICNSIFI